MRWIRLAEPNAIRNQSRVNDFGIPMHVEERHGLRRANEAIRVGVPLSQGLVHEPADLAVTDSAGAAVPHQARALAYWSDRSIKWLLVDALVSLEPFERVTLVLRPKARARGDDESRSGPRLRVTARSDAIEVDTGRACFEIRQQHAGPFSSVTMGTVSLLQAPGSKVRLTDRDNNSYEPTIERLFVEEQGPVKAVVVSEGRFQGPRGAVPLRFKSRAVFVAGSACVSLDIQIRNTRAAVHAGGLWDLGDRGSCFIQDLTLSVHPGGPASALRWYSEQAVNRTSGIRRALVDLPGLQRRLELGFAESSRSAWEADGYLLRLSRVRHGRRGRSARSRKAIARARA